MGNKNLLYVPEGFVPDVAVDPEKHIYMKMLKRYWYPLIKDGKAECYAADINHDDWCGIHKMGHCNCRPDIVISNIKTNKTVLCCIWVDKDLYIKSEPQNL
jgi:hypothetical protein